MRVSASSFYGLYRPSHCPLRIFLRAKGVRESEPGPYEQVIIDLGQKYEAAHLTSLRNVLDLTEGEEDERVEMTLNAIHQGAEVIYQALFKVQATIAERDITLVGAPDLLIKEEGGYRIRDVKLSRRITEKDHPEILFQLGMYGWLFEQATKTKPIRLEVLAGTGNVEEVPLAFIERVQSAVSRIIEISTAANEPFSPVGWTKCGACGFNSHCWAPAVERKVAAIVPGVDQGLATALRDKGVQTIDDLLKSFDERSLAAMQKPWGKGTQKVGKAAGRILQSARALANDQEEVLQRPEIPTSDNYVMFDLEGLPPQLDELDKIYLWGLQVFGKKPSAYMGIISEVGEKGDLSGWEGFLETAKGIFDEYGDIPFVHWHHYERTKISGYIERYGDRNAVAQRVKQNLLDLLPITQAAVALPIPSYSLKVVEKYVGFKRTQDEYGGDWSMATFIKATETSDEATRKGLLDAILLYNREDLEATWAVFEWLRGKMVSQ